MQRSADDFPSDFEANAITIEHLRFRVRCHFVDTNETPVL
jgi:hypothetical protein